MNPARFPQSNLVMKAPPGMDNCSDIHAFQGKDASGAEWCVTAWRPTPEELVKLNLGEPVFLYVSGRGMPPVGVTVDNPFQEQVPA